MEGEKNVAGEHSLSGGWLLADRCEVGSEALKRAGKGLRLGVLPRPGATRARVTLPDKKWLLVTGAPLTAAQAEQFQRWQQQVASLELITLY